MKASIMSKILLSCLIILISLAIGCCQNKSDNNSTKDSIDTNILVEKDNFNYTGSEFKGNYIWGGAMNLAWNDLIDNFIHEKIKLLTDESRTLATLHKFNNPVMTRQDIDDASYYIKSGYGQKTLDTINRESRKKFPSKSFADLDYDLGDTDIISYAYFLKEIKYLIAFAKQDMLFIDKPVKGFKATENSYENICILDYQNEDKFLISIKLKDSKDQIFVAKGYPMDKPDSLIAYLRAKAPAQTEANYNFGQIMDERDVFQAPILKVDHERNYEEMLNKVLEQKIQDREYYIAVMKEKIKFDMDEKGARVENEAVIIMKETAMGPDHSEYKPKIMKLDKPYWVVMKRYDSNNPYFILGVNNLAPMQKVD